MATSADDPQQKNRIAHILVVDIVKSTLYPIDEQARNVTKLNTLIRRTAEFQTADRSKNVVTLGTGDGAFLLFFSGPLAPVQCSVELWEALAAQKEFSVRMGVHSGLVIESEDINGKLTFTGGIASAQQVMNLGIQGHILLSHTTAFALSQFKEWRNKFRFVGYRGNKHGDLIPVFNLCYGGIGNPSPIADDDSQLTGIGILHRPEYYTYANQVERSDESPVSSREETNQSWKTNKVSIWLKGLKGRWVKQKPIPDEVDDIDTGHIMFIDYIGYSRFSLEQMLRKTEILSNIIKQNAEVQATTLQGTIVRSTGDGFMVVFFVDPLSPLRCAVDIATSLQAVGEDGYRIGIHSGLIKRVPSIDGNFDVVGDGPNIANRVLGWGDNRHILLSHLSAQFAMQFDEWRDGCTFLGEVSNKFNIPMLLFSYHKGTVGNAERPRQVREYRSNDEVYKSIISSIGVERM